MPAPDKVQLWLPLVRKPARYVGGERGSHPPDLDEKLRIVLAFPDLYEVGMCNQGLLFLYEMTNCISGVTCERAFLPAPDMASQMRVRRQPLYSLETGRPVIDADLLGISVPSPINITGVPALLGASGIPFLRTERRVDDPIVIVGGYAAFNPAPLSLFCDGFAIGEGDELLIEIVETLLIAKEMDATRVEKLRFLAKLDGLYLPGYTKRPVKKRVITDLKRAPHPAPGIISHIAPIHDRVALEAARGCVKGCRFCQAGMVTRPYREREPGELLGCADAIAEATGSGDISLLALNTADYSYTVPLLDNIQRSYPQAKVSLPALRLDDYQAAMGSAVGRNKPGQQTFAPEAGTQRLRDAINKPISDDDIIDGIRAAGENGVQRVKLYFMVGLPTETDEDLYAIADLAKRADRALKEGLGRFGQITVNVTAFIPQPHTPLQWEERPTSGEIDRRLTLVKKSLPRKVKFKTEDIRVSTLEAALARGGEELGPVILEAYMRGAKLDGWSEFFNYPVWVSAFEKYGLDLETYASRRLNIDEELPWSFIDVGLNDEFLKEEYRRTFDGMVTANCLDHGCYKCGVCHGGMGNTRAELPMPEIVEPKPHDVTVKAMRVRFTYAKEGIYRFLSHLDLYRVMQMALNRAGWPVAYSGGFAPKPRIELAPPLPLGAFGEKEWADVYICDKRETDELLSSLRKAGPDFSPDDIVRIELNAPSFFKSVSAADWYAEMWPLSELTEVSGEDVLQAIRARIAKNDYRYSGRKGEADATGSITKADVAAGVFFWRTLISEDGAIVNPYDLITGLGSISPTLARLALVKRSSLTLK